jgi:hypothetical protein
VRRSALGEPSSNQGPRPPPTVLSSIARTANHCGRLPIGVQLNLISFLLRRQSSSNLSRSRCQRTESVRNYFNHRKVMVVMVFEIFLGDQYREKFNVCHKWSVTDCGTHRRFLRCGSYLSPNWVWTIANIPILINQGHRSICLHSQNANFLEELDRDSDLLRMHQALGQKIVDKTI